MFDTIIHEENKSRFKELEQYPVIDNVELLRELIGEPVVISHYKSAIKDMLDRYIDRLSLKIFERETKLVRSIILSFC